VIQGKDEGTQPAQSGPLVLVVEDNAAIMDVYHFVLVGARLPSRHGARWRRRSPARQGLRPSIVILDMGMPKVSAGVPGALAQEVSAPCRQSSSIPAMSECAGSRPQARRGDVPQEAGQARILIAAIEMV
jgi:CheY-like chemotaxis protein